MSQSTNTRNRKNIKRRKKNNKLLKFLYATLRFFSKPIILVIIVISIAIYWFYYSGLYENTKIFISKKHYKFSKDSGLILKNVLLEGQKNTPKREIIKILTDSTLGEDKYLTKGDPLLNIDLANIQTKLSKMQWIESVTVERLFPSTLSIRILERVPVAIWQNQGKMSLIDTNGEMINVTNIENFADLIIIVGDEAPSHANIVFEIINKYPDIAQRVSSLIFVSKRRWNVRLFNDIEIKLPEQEAEQAWAEIAKMQKDTLILDSDVSLIDLRLADKIFVK
jgi:cell division protein FtsQ